MIPSVLNACKRAQNAPRTVSVAITSAAEVNAGNAYPVLFIVVRKNQVEAGFSLTLPFSI